MTTVGSEISSVKSQQRMRIPHLTKLILKTSKFRPEVWSVTKRKSASVDGRVLSPSSRFFSCHERPLLAEKAFDIVIVTVCLFTLRFLLRKVYLVLQRAKKVASDSLGLVDFAIGLVIFFLNLTHGQVLFLGGKFKLKKDCNQSCQSKRVLG